MLVISKTFSKLQYLGILIIINQLIWTKTTEHKSMNKKLKKIRNRLIDAVQTNISLGNSDQKNRSRSSKHKSSSKHKFRTLISEGKQNGNLSALKKKQKKVYLTDISQTFKTQIDNYGFEQKEENLKTNNLQDQLRYIPRVKSPSGVINPRTLRQSSKLGKNNKNVNLQFQNELYWNNNNSYLVTGVKNQYEKIKKSYEQKCLEIQKIKKQYKFDTIKELKLYIEKLQKQNTKIIDALQRYYSKRNTSSQVKSTPLHIVMENLSISQIEATSYNQLSQKMKKIQRKYQQLQKRYCLVCKQNNNLVAKISLQQKIIIEKQNKQLRAISTSKKTEKLYNQLKQNIQTINQKLKMQELNAEQKMTEMKKSLNDQNKQQNRYFHNQIQQKDSKIQRMQKQISYLHNLLQHWKLTQTGQYHGDDNQKSKGEIQIINDHYTKISLQQLQGGQLRNNQSKMKSKNSIQNGLSNNSLNRQLNSLLSQRSLNKSGLKNCMIQGKKSQYQIQNVTERQRATQRQRTTERYRTTERQRITAKTHNEQSVKCRPVQINEIEPIMLYLNLRLAYVKVNPQQILTYFGCEQHILPSHLAINNKIDQKSQKKLRLKQFTSQSNQKPSSWQQEYISLKQVYQIFLKQPFNLHSSQSLLFSRFIIQDVKQAYIYMNWDSQNLRRVVESILMNLLNFNAISEETINESQQLLTKFQINIIPALRSISGKTAKVSQQKFIQILNGLGLQRTKQMDRYLVGKMCAHSSNIQELQFYSLYNQINPS